MNTIYKVVLSAKFRRELKTCRKRGYDIDKFIAVVDLLARGVDLPLKNHDHALTGDYEGCRECHITPDWLLIYQRKEDALVLYMLRTGTHSDLF